jgi:16S rRNA C1402 N4-methylase RsmH
MITPEIMMEIINNPNAVAAVLHDLGYSRFRIRYYTRGLQRLTRHRYDFRPITNSANNADDVENVEFGD